MPSPADRVSRGFKDLSMSFQASPLSSDLIGLKNESAIARSVKNLIFTTPGERFFNPDLGSNLSRVLFSNMDDISSSIIKDEIETTINNFEPRVELLKVDVEPNYDNAEFNVRILYNIIGIDVPPQQLTFALQSTR